MLGQQAIRPWLRALPCPASLPGWSGSAPLLLELWLLRDVSRCQHGGAFNTYLYFQSMAVAQQPGQMFWVGVWLWRGRQQPARGRFCVAQAQERSQLQAPHLELFCSFFISWPHTRVDVFGLKSDPVFPCCVFISHPRREGDGNWEQVLNTDRALLWWLLLLIPAVQVLEPPQE